MRLEKIVWYDRHHVLLSFDKFSYALSRFPRSIKIPTLYQDCLCETSEAWTNFKQFKIFSRSPRPSRFTHALLRSSRFDHTTPYDPPAFLKRGERGKRDPSVNLAYKKGLSDRRNHTTTRNAIWTGEGTNIKVISTVALHSFTPEAFKTSELL